MFSLVAPTYVTNTTHHSNEITHLDAERNTTPRLTLRVTRFSIACVIVLCHLGDPLASSALSASSASCVISCRCHQLGRSLAGRDGPMSGAPGGKLAICQTIWCHPLSVCPLAPAVTDNVHGNDGVSTRTCATGLHCIVCTILSYPSSPSSPRPLLPLPPPVSPPLPLPVSTPPPPPAGARQPRVDDSSPAAVGGGEPRGHVARAAAAPAGRGRSFAAGGRRTSVQAVEPRGGGGRAGRAAGPVPPPPPPPLEEPY